MFEGWNKESAMFANNLSLWEIGNDILCIQKFHKRLNNVVRIKNGGFIIDFWWSSKNR